MCTEQTEQEIEAQKKQADSTHLPSWTNESGYQESDLDSIWDYYELQWINGLSENIEISCNIL